MIFMGVRARPCSPNWACLGQMPLHRTKLRMLSHVGFQLGSSWVQVGANWPESAQLMAKDAQVWPQPAWLGQVGPFLSSLSYSLGASGIRREATWIHSYLILAVQRVHVWIIGDHLNSGLWTTRKANHETSTCAWIPSHGGQIML